MEDGGHIFLIAGSKKIHLNRNSLMSNEETDWVYISVKEQIAAISRRHKSAGRIAQK